MSGVAALWASFLKSGRPEYGALTAERLQLTASGAPRTFKATLDSGVKIPTGDRNMSGIAAAWTSFLKSGRPEYGALTAERLQLTASGAPRTFKATLDSGLKSRLGTAR